MTRWAKLKAVVEAWFTNMADLQSGLLAAVG
jgi:hypothetical protein